LLTVTVVGVSIPSFLLALLLQIGSIAFYKRTGVRLVLFGPNLSGAESLLPKIALPAAVLAARPLAHVTRVTFIALSEVLEQDYVRTARAKGLREILVFWHHVLRNAGVRILTAAAVSLRFALGSMPVVEIFFDQAGLGVTMLNGIFRREVDLVAGAALGLGISLLLINMGLDVIYRVIDPTLRDSGNGSRV
jgi:peptide/nickel transport system permease protein